MRTTVKPLLFLSRSTSEQACNPMVDLGQCCPAPIGAAEISVALYFTPTDYIYATLLTPREYYFPPPEAGLRLSNGDEVSTPLDPVDQASEFEFVITHSLTYAPPPPPDYVTGSWGTYTDYIGSALIQFTDLSSTGAAGDFGLSLSCTEQCRDIGFHLGGQDFSFFGQPDVSLALYYQEFRNSSGVPEPGTWVMMLIGFGAAGLGLRRERARSLRFRQPSPIETGRIGCSCVR